jgi:hypothetical protein
MNRKEGQTKIHPNPTPGGERKPAESGRLYGGGKHFRDAPRGPSDLERNPGIGSSAGSFSSGESGIAEADETSGVTPREE